jgi:hypothetical protein
MHKLIIAVILLTLASSAQAEVYFELGIEGGGVPIVTTDRGDINPGGGFKIAMGVQNGVGENGDKLSIALGYIFDGVGETSFWYEPSPYEFSTITLDAIYTIGIDSHRFGIGGSYHIGPTINDNVLSSALDFDDALGLILQYSYTFADRFQIGARLTSMDYKVSGLTADASSFGIFLSNGF